MKDDEFEWHDDKAAENLKKHEISFEAARRVFIDSSRIDEYDSNSNSDEDRFFTIGEVDGKLYFVSYTIVDDRIRIISARKATKREFNAYYRGKAAS